MKKTQIHRGNIVQRNGTCKLWKIGKRLKNSKIILNELETIIPKTVGIKELEENYEQWI